MIVTGSGSGIGKELATDYAVRGYRVVIAEKDADRGEQLAQQLCGNGYEALFIETDVRSEDSIAALMQTVEDRFGRLDVLINNAGISRWKPVYELTAEEWDDVTGTNLRGAFLCAREAAKRMRRNERGGSIVNISSTRAHMSEPHSEAYAASKGGITALTHALALSLGPDRIRVNVISPGWIETGDYGSLRPIDHAQHPAGRVGMPSDIVRACRYLTDPDNGFVTGIDLIVDGGMTRKMIYEP